MKEIEENKKFYPKENFDQKILIKNRKKSEEKNLSKKKLIEKNLNPKKFQQKKIIKNINFDS